MIMNNSNEAKNNGCNRIQTDVNQNYLKYGKYNLNNQNPNSISKRQVYERLNNS